jgi:TatD DNase family protein
LQWQQGLSAGGSPLVERPGVLHSYSGDAAQAQRALAGGFYLGITGPVTFKKADTLRQIVVEAPLERLLIETDSPYLTPEPYRGKRNQPAYVKYIVDRIAQERKLTPEEVALQTSDNAARLLNW